ncbi:MAG TPA: acyl carrier protein [Tepidiformaceae bacterium]|nr:acyl carrier protein [Tepidiformaceae bacterium]
MPLFERVRDVVVSQLKVSPDEVTPEANLIDDLRADSLDIVDLTIAIEEAFADEATFEIRDEDAENIHTVQDILDFLTAQGLS